MFALLAPFAQFPFLSQAIIGQCLLEAACFIHVPDILGTVTMNNLWDVLFPRVNGFTFDFA